MTIFSIYFLLFPSLVEIGDYCFAKRLLPPGQEENLFHHKTECIDTWEKFRKIIYLSKIPWWIIYCRYEKVFDSKSLFRPSFIHPPHGLKSFHCWPKNNSWSFFPSSQRYSNWIIIVEIFSQNILSTQANKKSGKSFFNCKYLIGENPRDFFLKTLHYGVGESLQVYL